MRRTAWLLALAPLLFGAAEPGAADYAADAKAIAPLIAANYAYLDRLPGNEPPHSAALEAMRDAVHDRASLIAYAEAMMTALADHHAITGASSRAAWAIVPSYADLWIVRRGDAFLIDAVRADSIAEHAGIKPGERLVAVDGTPIATAVSGFWRALGLRGGGERDDYAARVLGAGRRDRPRLLTIAGGQGARTLTLPNLYGKQDDAALPLTVTRTGTAATIRIENSLGDRATVAAFDAAMTTVRDARALTVDLTNTPSGGTTSVARAMMSWFVDRPTPYQIHDLPAEERETGIARRWIEEVLPRAGKRYRGTVTVKVGRWTGSMGEGLAIGLAATGARLCGTRMAGLRGAVYDFPLPASGAVVKFPAERLYAVNGVPREQVVPPPCR